MKQIMSITGDKFDETKYKPVKDNIETLMIRVKTDEGKILIGLLVCMDGELLMKSCDGLDSK